VSPDIWIDDDVFDAIKHQAVPFEDRQPNDVLRRVLLTDSPEPQEATPAASTPTEQARVVPTTRRAPASAAGRTRSKTTERKAAKRTRVPSSALMPEANYRLPILRVLSDAGGRMATSEAIAAVGDIVYDQLKPADLELQGTKPRWEQRIQFTRLRLVEDKLMKKESPRGTWEITEAGEKVVSDSIKVQAVDGARAEREAATA
jgi:Mrr N-terminal domain